jgi:hypothetical protein
MDKANYTLEDSPKVPLRVRYKSGNIHHESLAHMWKDWYQEYYEASFPRLVIRLEDVVFYPKQVLQSVCDCVGGTLTTPLVLRGDSAKNMDPHMHGKDTTNLADAMVSHILFNRTRNMTHDDVRYAEQVFQDSVLEKFGYRLPV